jgi:CRP/FNR family transcriptional regulator, cyclic AMP receptor protein
MKKIYVKKGKSIFLEGTPGECAYIIESGSVEVSKTKSNGQVISLGTLYEKDLVGELGLIDGLPRTATVTAIEDCTVSILTQEAFNSLARRNPQSLIPILKILAKRLRSALNVVEYLNKKQPNTISQE